MIYDVVEVKVLAEHTVHLRFEDGTEGSVDISKLVAFKGIFRATVAVDPESGTICWDNGADFAPETLYQAISEAAA